MRYNCLFCVKKQNTQDIAGRGSSEILREWFRRSRPKSITLIRKIVGMCIQCRNFTVDESDHTESRNRRNISSVRISIKTSWANPITLIKKIVRISVQCGTTYRPEPSPTKPFSLHCGRSEFSSPRQSIGVVCSVLFESC